MFDLKSSAAVSPTAPATLNTSLLPVGSATLLPLQEIVGAGGRARLFPLWRHAAWLLALFVVSAFAVSVRLEVQNLRKDLDRTTRQERLAEVLNERLHLEMDARRRASAMEQLALRMNLGRDARVVRVEGTP